MKRIVEDLDAIRALRLFNTSDTIRLISRAGLEDELWEKTKSSLREIALILVNHPDFRKIERADRISTYMFVASFAASLTALILMLLNVNIVLSYLVLLASLIILNASYIGKLYVGVSVRRVYMERRSDVEKHGELLKKAAENALSKLRGELRKAGMDPSQVTFKLYFNDYSPLKQVGSSKGMHKLTYK